MQLQQPFDATKFDPTQGGAQLPVGKHPVIISESEITATRDQESGMLVLTLQIIDGPSKGQNGDYRLNLYNKSAKACEIAHKQLSAVCHVTGVYQVSDSRALHNIPFVIEVGLQKDPEAAAKGYTEVKRVFDMNGNEPGKSNGGAQATGGATNGAAAGGGNAWGQGGQQQPAAQQQPQTGNTWGGNNAAPGGGNAPAGGGPAWGGGGNANANGNAPASDKPSWAK